VLLAGQLRDVRSLHRHWAPTGPSPNGRLIAFNAADENTATVVLGDIGRAVHRHDPRYAP
jgi:hypothetical protein